MLKRKKNNGKMYRVTYCTLTSTGDHSADEVETMTAKQLAIYANALDVCVIDWVELEA